VRVARSGGVDTSAWTGMARSLFLHATLA
jgi:hypothetical protein